jgi:hypothetical protein
MQPLGFLHVCAIKLRVVLQLAWLLNPVMERLALARVPVQTARFEQVASFLGRREPMEPSWKDTIDSRCCANAAWISTRVRRLRRSSIDIGDEKPANKHANGADAPVTSDGARLIRRR